MTPDSAKALTPAAAALRVAVENFDSTETCTGPTTNALVDAALRWHLAASPDSAPAQETDVVRLEVEIEFDGEKPRTITARGTEFDMKAFRILVDRALATPPPQEAVPCKHGDKLCPCQDGDACHYEGKDAFAVTQQPVTSAVPVGHLINWPNQVGGYTPSFYEGRMGTAELRTLHAVANVTPLYAAPIAPEPAQPQAAGVEAVQGCDTCYYADAEGRDFPCATCRHNSEIDGDDNWTPILAPKQAAARPEIDALRNLQAWLIHKLIGTAATPDVVTIKRWISALAPIIGEEVPSFAAQENSECKFASGGARCVSHCGDYVCLAAAARQAPTGADAVDAECAKSLPASIADALRPFVSQEQKVIWREPFRWHDDAGVMSNHYDSMSAETLAECFDYEVIEDCGCAAIIAARKAQPTRGEA